MVAPNSELPRGTVLQGRFEVGGKITVGGMGRIYKAKDLHLGRKVVLKENMYSYDPVARQKFEHEAQLLGGLKHESLPTVYDHFIEGGQQFLVMQYIEGDDLKQMLDDGGSAFAVDEVLGWADQLFEVLIYLHTLPRPVIHRDIKPQNLKLAPDGRLYLLDFGLAKGPPPYISGTVSSQSVWGYTASYASPEQIEDQGTDARSDLYSLAATLYHLITDACPITANIRGREVHNGLPDPLLPADQVNPQVPGEIARVLAGAMELNPDDRPSSVAELRQQLEDAQKTLIKASMPPAVSPPAPVTPSSTPSPSNPMPGPGTSQGGLPGWVSGHLPVPAPPSSQPAPAPPAPAPQNPVPVAGGAPQPIIPTPAAGMPFLVAPQDRTRELLSHIGVSTIGWVTGMAWSFMLFLVLPDWMLKWSNFPVALLLGLSVASAQIITMRKYVAARRWWLSTALVIGVAMTLSTVLVDTLHLGGSFKVSVQYSLMLGAVGAAQLIILRPTVQRPWLWLAVSLLSGAMIGAVAEFSSLGILPHDIAAFLENFGYASNPDRLIRLVAISTTAERLAEAPVIQGVMLSGMLIGLITGIVQAGCLSAFRARAGHISMPAAGASQQPLVTTDTKRATVFLYTALSIVGWGAAGLILSLARFDESSTIAVIFYALVQGAIIGGAQAIVLRKYLPSEHWMLVTMGGAVLAALVRLFLLPHRVNSVDMLIAYTVAVVTIILACQAVVLYRYIQPSVLWILLGVVASVVGLWLNARYSHNNGPFIAYYGEALSGTVYRSGLTPSDILAGMTIGLITGIAQSLGLTVFFSRRP